MADYPQGRAGPPRPNQYGHASNHEREAAFSNIFGAAPPPGRSQTMTSSTSPPAPMNQIRTQTMSSQASGQYGGMQRSPPPRQQDGGYPSPSGYMPNGGGMQNGYHQGPRQPPPGQVQSQPQPHYLPQQVRPDRRPYPSPNRVDPRGGPSQQAQYAQRNPVPRYYPGNGPGPALNSDPYRSQSMASMSRPQMYSPSPNNFQQAPASTFRQAPYQSHASRTTAQGRIVPERHDERAMSMTSYPQDRDQHQTMSGRIIPNRRTSQSGQEIQGNGYPIPGPRSPATQTRTTSMASTTVGDMSRTMSMASTIAPSERTETLTHRPSVAKSVSSSTDRRQKSPLVYPALL